MIVSFSIDLTTVTRTADALAAVMESWIGYSEANRKHKIIIDIYNSHKPLARGYAVQYSDQMRRIRDRKKLPIIGFTPVPGSIIYFILHTGVLFFRPQSQNSY